MDGRTKDALRGAATALGVAAGLFALASTAQTPDGYIHASFGGPLDVFSSSTTDYLSIGDGTNDANELAALLKGPLGPLGPAARSGAPDSPYRVAFEAGAAPNATTGAATVMPSLNPILPAAGGKDPAILPSKPVVDAQGRIDCTGSVSCKTDPATNTTTVTYPDGVIAVVQKINDLTVVAYKTITEALPSEIATLLPPAPETPPVLAAVAPTAAAVPPPAPRVPSLTPTPVLETTAPTTNPSVGESTPDPKDITLPKDITPPSDLTAPPKDPARPGTGITGPTPSLPNKVKDALGGIADTVKDALGSVGKALNPGASTKPETGQSGTSGQPATADQTGNSDRAGDGKAGAGDSADSGRSGSDEG